MTGNHWLAAFVALFLWWFSTGVILWRVRRADNGGPDGHLRSVLLGLPLLILGRTCWKARIMRQATMWDWTSTPARSSLFWCGATVASNHGGLVLLGPVLVRLAAAADPWADVWERANHVPGNDVGLGHPQRR
jgi:hypothetical protein